MFIHMICAATNCIHITWFHKGFLSIPNLYPKISLHKLFTESKHGIWHNIWVFINFSFGIYSHSLFTIDIWAYNTTLLNIKIFWALTLGNRNLFFWNFPIYSTVFLFLHLETHKFEFWSKSCAYERYTVRCSRKNWMEKFSLVEDVWWQKSIFSLVFSVNLKVFFLVPLFKKIWPHIPWKLTNNIFSKLNSLDFSSY